MIAHAAIPPKFYWIRHMALLRAMMADVGPAAACRIGFVDGVIRDYVMQIAITDGAMAPPARRTTAIILGAARLGMIDAWRLDDADIKPAERSDSRFGVGMIAYAGGIAPIAAAADAAHTAVPYTPAEMALIYASYHLGIGAIGAVAWSLATSSHHFLGQGIFNGLLKEAGWVASAGRPVPADLAVGVTEAGGLSGIKDILFHKAAHPVSEALLEAFAHDGGTKLRLAAARYGSVAARLPVEPGKSLGLSSAISLVLQVEPTIVRHGGNVDALKAALLAARDGIGHALDGAGVAAATTLAQGVLEERMSQLAFCHGMFAAQCDAIDLRHTLTRSNMLQRIARDFVSEVARGNTFARAARQHDMTLAVGALAPTF
jgi:hypothetical protein